MEMYGMQDNVWNQEQSYTGTFPFPYPLPKIMNKTFYQSHGAYQFEKLKDSLHDEEALA